MGYARIGTEGRVRSGSPCGPPLNAAAESTYSLRSTSRMIDFY